jgi:nitrogenase molybdenum-iron protein NifN
MGTTYGGTTLDEIRSMGRSALTIAIGEQMREAATRLAAKTGVPYRFLDGLVGLPACDQFVSWLQEVVGKPAPERLRRQRGQLVDAMLDGHFYFGGTRFAVAGDPDLTVALATWLADLGGEVVSAVVTSETAALARLPAAEVIVGDLDDFERAAAERDAQVLVTHSHGRTAAERLRLPHFRIGFPMFDRLGAAHKRSVGYRGSRDLIFEMGNLIIEHTPEAAPSGWSRGRETRESGHAGAQAH